MAAGTVRVKGLDQLVRDFGRLEKELKREVQRELAEVAAPVAADARRRADRYGARTSSGVRHRVRGGRAYVEQRRGKVTGKRGDFGALQMRKVFLPALNENTPRIVRGLERMLDRIAGDHGF